MSTPNAAHAWRVMDHIDANTELHEQDTWLHKTKCGTAGCYAGWTCLLAGDKPLWGGPDADLTFMVEASGEARPVRVDRRAQELLGLDDDAADDLFNPHNSRSELRQLVAEIFGERPELEAEPQS